MGTWSLVLNDIYQIIFNRVTLRTAAKRFFTHLISKKDQLPPAEKDQHIFQGLDSSDR